MNSNLAVKSDALIIIPPFAPLDMPAMGAQLLQKTAFESGFSVELLYANFDLALRTGFSVYQQIAQMGIYFDFISEKLFAASAFNLPSSEYNTARLRNPFWIPEYTINDHQKQKKTDEIILKLFKRNRLDIQDYYKLENTALIWIEEIASRIVAIGYSVVGCTTTLTSLCASLALLRKIKEKNPSIITILGGAQCEEEMAEGILSTGVPIDYIFRGESDLSFPHFLRNVKLGKLPQEKIIQEEKIIDLNALPCPDFTDYFNQLDLYNKKAAAPIQEPTVCYETSRGCWWKRCNFCGLNGNRHIYRFKDPEKVIDDFKKISTQHNIRRIQMVDNIMPYQYYKSLLPKLAEEFSSLQLFYEIKANVTLEMMISLKRAGVSRIQPGIEALSDSLLEKMQKGVSAKQNIAFLRYARILGMEVYWYIMFGFPGDKAADYEDLLNLIPLLHHLPPPQRMNRLLIYQFSPYSKFPEKFGIRNLKPLEDYGDIFPKGTDLEKIAGFFTGDFESESQKNFEIIDKSLQALETWNAQWNRPDLTLPNLHVTQENPDKFILNDTRYLPGTLEKRVLNRDTAKKILVTHHYDKMDDLQWAIDAKLGIISNSYFIPLATAAPELLMEFEKSND